MFQLASGAGNMGSGDSFHLSYMVGDAVWSCQRKKRDRVPITCLGPGLAGCLACSWQLGQVAKWPGVCLVVCSRVPECHSVGPSASPAPVPVT